MKTVTIEGFIHAYKYDWDDNYRYQFSTCDDLSNSCQIYFNVCPHTLTFTVPDTFNPVAQEVAALERQKSEALKAYTRKVAEINDRIKNLQCLEAPKEVEL